MKTDRPEALSRVPEAPIPLLGSAGAGAEISGGGSEVSQVDGSSGSGQDGEEFDRSSTDRLLEFDEMRTTFLHAVSHDLRGPVTAILGAASTIERFDPPDEERAAFVSSIRRNAEKLRRLLNDLLDLDRMDRGILPLDLEPANLNSLIATTIETADLPADRSVTVDVRLAEATVDVSKVERILENLLTNAVRHTRADVPIWVRVEAADGGVVMTVEDAGPGVAPEDRATLFEPFHQGLDAATRGAGAGIGLSLVARFAEMHRGRAWVEERPGGGASFKVFLSNADRASGSPPTARPA